MAGIKVNIASLKAALANGPLNMAALAIALGRSSAWDLEADLKDMENGWRMMVDNGVEWSNRFTVFPARERARYGFPDIVPVNKPEDPKRKKRAKRARPIGPDGKPVPEPKVQTQYWPLVAWGDITPAPTGQDAYDGRWDAVKDKMVSILAAAGFGTWLESEGYDPDFDVRGIKSGISIRLNSAEPEPEPDDSGEDVDTGDHSPVS